MNIPKDDIKIRFVQDNSYINWRFNRHPYSHDRSYSIVSISSYSYVIYSIYKPLKQLNILLSSFASSKDENLLLNFLIKLSKEKGAEVFRFLNNSDFVSETYKTIIDKSSCEEYFLIRNVWVREPKVFIRITFQNLFLI